MEVGVSRAGRKGFTLIELLVVIAIIAILAAILFPVFARAKESARLAKCQSHIKQAGGAVLMYVDDWNNTFPTCVVRDPATGRAIGGSYPTGQWVAGNSSRIFAPDEVPAKHLRPCYGYCSRAVYMWQCPSEPLLQQSQQDAKKFKDFDYWGNSYPMNAAFGWGNNAPWGNEVLYTLSGRKIAAIVRSTKVIMLGERGIHQYFWAGLPAADLFRNHDKLKCRVPVCFVDGHVGYVLIVGDQIVNKRHTYGLSGDGWILAEKAWYGGKFPSDDWC